MAKAIELVDILRRNTTILGSILRCHIFSASVPQPHPLSVLLLLLRAPCRQFFIQIAHARAQVLRSPVT